MPESAQTSFPRRAARAAVALAAATALAACGQGSAPSSSGGGSASTPSGSIRVLANWSGTEGEAFQAVVDGFTAANPSVTVKVDVVPFDQTQSVLTQQFAAGNPPDASVALPGIVRQLSGQGLLLNLDALWDGWLAGGEYNDSLRAVAAGSDAHTDAVYFKGNVNGLIWYKTSVAEAKGMTTPPATWADYTALLDKIKTSGTVPFAVGGKDVWVPTQWVDPILLSVAGIDTYTKLQQGKIRWSDPKVIEAFTVLAGLMKNYWPTDALDTGFTDEVCGWVSGKHVFGDNGAFVNGVVASCDKSLKPGTDYTFFPQPPYQGTGAAPQAVSGDLFVGAQSTKNQAATIAFLKYLGSVDAQSIWAERGGYIAPNMKVPTSVYPSTNDQKAAALWPKDAQSAAGYDLDDWIGGQIQVKYRENLDQLIRTQDVNAFIAAMEAADTRPRG
jgi:alpha-glucoside transport system substrate-binding protein